MSNLIQDTEQSEFVVYRLLTGNPTFYMSGYVDRTGIERYVAEGKDRNGNEKRKRFEFKNKMLKVHKNLKEQIEFLDNSPFIEGSPNHKGGKLYYTKVNLSGDATKRVESKSMRLEAGYKALNLDKNVLEMVAIMNGSTSPDPAIQKDIVIQFAERNPEEFLKMVSDDNLHRLEVRAFVRDAVKRGVIKQQGNTFSWEGRPLGKGEDEVVDAMIEDVDLYTYCRESVDQLTGKQSAPAKKRGRPKKSND